MISAAGIAAIYGAVLHRIGSNAYGATGDFLSFYGAGYLVRTGQASSLYDPAALNWVQRALYPGDFDEAIGYPLPVFVAWGFTPLSTLPFTTSFFVFMAAMSVLLAAIVVTFRQYLANVPPVPRNLFLFCAAFGMPSIASIVFGQVDLIALAGLVLAYLSLREGRPRMAGLALCLVLVKPHMLAGAGLLLLVRREWTALGTLAVAGIPLLVLPALLSAPEALIDNLRIIASYPGADKELAVNAAVMPNWRGFVVSITNSDNIAFWLPGVLIIAPVAIAAAVRRFRDGGLDQAFAVAAMLPLLISPHAHTQNLVLLLLPGAILLETYLGEGAPAPRQLRAANLLLLAYTLAFALPIGAIMGLSLGFVPVLGMFWMITMRWPAAAVMQSADRQLQIAA